MSVLYMVILSLLAYVVLGEEDDILKPINSVTPWFDQIIFEFCCIIWVGVIIYLNHLAATFAKERAKKIEGRPLPDILHDILPHINRYTPDYLMFLSLVLCIFDIKHVDVVILLCCLTLRPIFVCVTTFPSCVEMTDSKSMYSKLFLSTHDLMFSGHTCIFTFCGLIIGGPLGFVIKFLFPISLIAARQHYTIDVIVAMFVYRFCALTL